MFIPQTLSLSAPLGDLSTANCTPETSSFTTALRNECVCSAQEVKMVLEYHGAEGEADHVGSGNKEA